MVAALAQLWPKFASYYWLRLSLFCAWAAYGVVPTAHFVVLNGGLGRSDHRPLRTTSVTVTVVGIVKSVAVADCHSIR